MKHILRSPIEPEFAYWLKTTLRKKREAMHGRLQSALTRSRMYILAKKKTVQNWYEEVLKRIQSWKEEYQARRVVVVKESPKAAEAGIVNETVQPVASQMSETAQEKLKLLLNRFKGFEWRPLLDRWQILAAMFVLALMVGMGAKAIARDSVTIGFEDYKLPPTEKIVDLNTVQERFLSDDWTPPAGNPYVGEQCTE